MSQERTEESGRKWWVAELADEVMPPGLTSPDLFVVAMPDGTFRLDYPANTPGVDEDERNLFRRPLGNGDIVNFLCCDDFGLIDISIGPSGTYGVHGSAEALAVITAGLPTHFWLPGDIDTLASSIEEFVNFYLENDPIKEPRTETVCMARWSDELPHKFEIARRKFCAVSQAEARQ
jgi:hypothetical protein